VTRRALHGLLALAALVVVLFPAVPSAAAAPALQIVLTNPDYETYAVDQAGIAYGSPVTARNEIWRSLDEGRTWTKRSDFPDGYRPSYITTLASGTLLAAADTGSWNFFRSDDGAATWTPVLEFPVTPCFYGTLTSHSVTEGDGFVFAGTYNLCDEQPNTNYVYRSGDDGRTWSVVHTSTDRRHIHGLRFVAATHTLLALYGDSNGAIERSLDDGVTWTPYCTDHSDCVGIDMALGDGFGIFGTDTPERQNSIIRIDFATGETTRVFDIDRVSYSALGLGSGRFLVGTTHEDGSDVKDGLVHLYASDDDGESFTDVYSAPVRATGPTRLQVQFAYPNGDFPIQLSGGGTVVARLGTPTPPVAPANTALPSISGLAQQTLTLTASTGTWSGTTPTFGYTWLRCTPKGAGCAAIPGATSSSYQLVAADAGHSLKVTITATNGAGAASATSAKSAVVVALAPPTNVTLPSIGGTALPGQTLDVSTGGWSGNPSAYSYSWLRCTPKGTGCVAIAGATSSTYQAVVADVGHSLRVAVTATNAGGAASVTSGKTALVTGPTPPTSVALPLIGGVAQQGQTLSASTGTWSGSPTSYAYVWQRCSRKGGGCVAIAGGTSSTYQLVEADIGQTLRVSVTAINDAGSSTPVTSNRSAVVLASA